MKTAKDIEEFVRNTSFRAGPGLHRRTIDDALEAQHRSRRAVLAGRRPNVWRIIASNNFRKFAAAAIILAAALGSTVVLRRGSGAVYAIEQTVEAFGGVSVVHVFGRDWHDRQVEIWGNVNPDTGLMDCWHVRYVDEGLMLVSTPQNTFLHDEKANTIRIQDGPSVTSIFRLDEFFQGMEHLAERLDGKITYSGVIDAGTKQNLIELKMSASNKEIVALIDSKTKLPISIRTTRGGPFGNDDILKDATRIRYDDTPPAGVFDFTIPAGAHVSVSTSEDILRDMPLSVLRYCAEFHVKTASDQAGELHIPVNTRLYYIDKQSNLHDGGFVGLHNDSNEVWKGDVCIFNVDPPHMALFDATSGKKQQIHLIQHRQIPPGRFRVYWTLEEPIHPGQTRYGVYWTSDDREILNQSNDSAYNLTMSNSFGCEAIENFMLIVPEDLKVSDSSTKYLSCEDVDGFRIYIWQRHLPKHRENNTVEATLAYYCAEYTADYIAKNTGEVLVEIPEVFELANIAIALSDFGLSDPYRVHKRGAYYQKMLDHFRPFRDHPLIREPDLNCHLGYMFRDNSICYAFDEDRIVHGRLYSCIRRPNLFEKHLKLVEDFAKISNFRKFYRDNLPYYQEQIRLYGQKVPVREMWRWLEERFPSRHDCYKVVFSPLLGGSHETCSFEGNGFSEIIMFISGPGDEEEYSDAVGGALLARVVFTEIDHNYVNSVTADHADRVTKAFADLDAWNKQEGYRSPEHTFNEYMTWAVFLLYAHDTYDQNVFKAINTKVADQMVHGRKFVRFNEFVEELLRLYQNQGQDQFIPALYPAVLDWAGSNSMSQ